MLCVHQSTSGTKIERWWAGARAQPRIVGCVEFTGVCRKLTIGRGALFPVKQMLRASALPCALSSWGTKGLYITEDRCFKLQHDSKVGCNWQTRNFEKWHFVKFKPCNSFPLCPNYLSICFKYYRVCTVLKKFFNWDVNLFTLCHVA